MLVQPMDVIRLQEYSILQPLQMMEMHVPPMLVILLPELLQTQQLLPMMGMRVLLMRVILQQVLLHI